MLEIGTGSGYQAAVLSQLAREVYTIEIVAPLGEQAQRTLDGLGYKNVARADRRRLQGLAGGGAVRRHHRHRRAGEDPRSRSSSSSRSAAGW